MDTEEDVCNVYPEVLVYSMQMEWMGLDGQTYVNSSVRVEWSETDSRAVCEVPKKLSDTRYEFIPQEIDLSGHCARCLVQVLAFASLFLLLLRSLGVHSARSTPTPSLTLPDCQRNLNRRLVSVVHPVQRRSLSAAAVLEKRFHKPFVTARWGAVCLRGLYFKLYTFINFFVLP